MTSRFDPVGGGGAPSRVRVRSSAVIVPGERSETPTLMAVVSAGTSGRFQVVVVVVVPVGRGECWVHQSQLPVLVRR
ncbi:MAG: hypothetical protein R2704_16710 [Microthrixaceae bacterium]